jgi:hypothetical protein
MLPRATATLCLLALGAPSCAQGPEVEVAFTVRQKDLVPEGIAYDAAEKRFYLGSIHWKKIVRVDRDGRVADFTSSSQDGLGEVLGLRVDPKARDLWACSNEGEDLPGGRSSVHRFDLRTGRLVGKYEIAAPGETHLFNDLFILASGDVFVTDSDLGALYRIARGAGAPELFLKSEDLRYVNGITSSPDESRLVVSSAKGLFSVDLASRAVTRVKSMGYLVVADGLYRHDRSLIAIQNVFFPVSVVQYDLDDSFGSVERATVLASDHPSFHVPTTGVVVGDDFYFIANSQVDEIHEGRIARPERLKDVVVLKARIRRVRS